MPNAQKGIEYYLHFFLIKNEYDISAISWVLYYKKNYFLCFLFYLNTDMVSEKLEK